jgi:hypothetical protein
VAIPTRASESGIALVFKPLFPLFPPEALESMKQSGIFALSEPGKLDQTLGAAGLTAFEDKEIELSIVFDDSDAAERAFCRSRTDSARYPELGRAGCRTSCARRACPLYWQGWLRLAPRLLPSGDCEVLIQMAKRQL